MEEDSKSVEQLIQARLHFLHHRLLSSNTLELQDKCLGLYEKALKGLSKVGGLDSETHGRLLVEYSRCLLSFYKYKQSEDAL